MSLGAQWLKRFRQVGAEEFYNLSQVSLCLPGDRRPEKKNKEKKKKKPVSVTDKLNMCFHFRRFYDMFLVRPDWQRTLVPPVPPRPPRTAREVLGSNLEK